MNNEINEKREETEIERLAKRIQELQSDLAKAKSQIEKMKNWCNCQNYLECLTNYVEKTKQSYKKEFCYNCKKWKLKER